MRVALVVAMARNRVIGRDNALPWRLPGDLRYFRAVTLGKPVIMGRRTFESIGRPLPGRSNIVLSAAGRFVAPPGVIAAHDIDTALDVASRIARRDGVTECMVIGGARVYEQCLDRADRIYLTLIDADIAGDTAFPPLCPEEWRETARSEAETDPRDEWAYVHIVMDRNSELPIDN